MNRKNKSQIENNAYAGNASNWGLVAILVIILALASYFIFGRNGFKDGQREASTNQIGRGGIMGNATSDGAADNFSFKNPKKSAHYESNTPTHGAVLAGPPVNVVIDFNFDLAPPSTISIKMGGKEYGVGDIVIDESKLAMRKNFDTDAPDGLYDVTYDACWPDGSCHDGKFQFAVDRSLVGEFTDLRGKSEVMVRMENVAFDPKNIIVSPGTKVTWIQGDSVEHFVNTDSHPAHSYYPPQNSRGLGLGDTFPLIFEKAGIYPYHCSAHAGTMTATILVK